MRQKSILDMVDDRLAVAENNGNNVESGFDVQVGLEKIGIGGSNEHPLFFLRHGQIRLAVVVALARLYLHDD